TLTLNITITISMCTRSALIGCTTCAVSALPLVTTCERGALVAVAVVAEGREPQVRGLVLGELCDLQEAVSALGKVPVAHALDERKSVHVVCREDSELDLPGVVVEVSVVTCEVPHADEQEAREGVLERDELVVRPRLGLDPADLWHQPHTP